MTMPARPHIALLGLGLMGASLARALKARRLVRRLSGYAPSAATRARARALGLVDEVVRAPEACVRGADFVFLNMPVGQMEASARAIASALKPGAIVTDVGSVKRAPARLVRRALPAHIVYVPGHPIAGTEQTGPDAGFAELFENRFCVLTPRRGTERRALMAVRRLWEQMGARVIEMTPAAHDRLLALTSHLPHLVAYGLTATARRSRQSHKAIVNFSAGGFRDFTRIAASDPVMWRDIFLHNRDAVLAELARFEAQLKLLRTAIEQDDGAALLASFQSVRRLRREIVAAGQEEAAPDFGRRRASVKPRRASVKPRRAARP